MIDLAGLPPLCVAGRMGRLRALIDAQAIDGLLCTDLVSIRYLTGFTGSNAQLLVTPDDALFVTDGRYGEQAEQQLGANGVSATIAVNRSADEETVPKVAALSRLGLEAEHVTWARQRHMSEQFGTTELVATEGLVASLRRVKDDGEVARLEAAAAVADAALADVQHGLHEGVTERAFSRRLDERMRELGAVGPSFETIVASGPNGARPHARPSNRTIIDGDLVVVDFGALVDGYHSDMTRTIAIGTLSATQRRMLEVVTEAQAAGVAMAGPDIPAREVDAVCRRVITDAGWGDAFLHGTGHGIGLQIHEDPRLSTVSDDVLRAGDCVTVEPGVYLPEHGGVRVEDSIVITDSGSRTLTHAPKA